MSILRWFSFLLNVTFLIPAALSADQVELKTVTWKIGTVQREALVYAPAGDRKPVIFAWHGHGGTSNYAARKFAFHTLWPECVVIYPQGLPTPSPLVDPQGKRSGWQRFVGDQEDRDLQFFDAMLKTCLAEYSVDADNVFSAGHSNGGYFTYLLDAARGDKLTAIAPVAAAANPHDFNTMKPKPVFHAAGENDPIVKFTLQQKTVEAMKRLNHCDPQGKPWAAGCIEYPSSSGDPVVMFIHDGRHEVPEGVPDLIVRFFKQQLRK